MSWLNLVHNTLSCMEMMYVTACVSINEKKLKREVTTKHNNSCVTSTFPLTIVINYTGPQSYVLLS